MPRNLVRIVVGLCTAIAVGIGGSGIASADTTTTTYSPGTLESFTWVSGLQSWKVPSRNRLMNSTFHVSGSTFVMTQPDGYPTLRGSIDPDGLFEASAHSSNGGGTVDVEVEGELTGASMTLTFTSGAATAAVVDGTTFGENRTKAFRAEFSVTGS